MNSNELMKDLYKILKTSGWLDKATEYFQKHPERFKDCTHCGGKIANINMSVSYQPKSFSAVANTKPNVFISIGNVNDTMCEYNVYDNDNSIAQSRTWVNGEIIMEDKSNV